MWVGTIAGLNYWTTELDYWTHPNCHKCLVQCRTETKCTYPLSYLDKICSLVSSSVFPKLKFLEVNGHMHI